MERLTTNMGTGRPSCEMCESCHNCWYSQNSKDGTPCNQCVEFNKFEPVGFCRYCGRPLTEEAKTGYLGLGGDCDPARLQELVEADKDDRLVIRPVKLGTPVWSTVFCRIDDDGVEHPTYPWDFSDSMLPEWGTGWHLTEADALKALEDDFDIDGEEAPDDPND